MIYLYLSIIFFYVVSVIYQITKNKIIIIVYG